MLKKAVLLAMLLTMLGCQPKAPAPTHSSHAASPHVHVDPLPGLPTETPHADYHVVINGTTVVLENANGTAAQYTDFAITHGERVHLMIIDPSLTDYHHIHPVRTRSDTLAIYTIDVAPTRAGQYRLFADVTPTADGTQRFLSTSFEVPGTPRTPHFAPLAIGEIAHEATLGTLTFHTEIDQPLRAGEEIMLNITVKDKEGNLFRELEPLMQAFAHLIGFSENRETIMHAHPMGREVTAENARGGPNLMFHVTFPTAGYYRLFLQVRVHDDVLTVPLDARVAP